MGDIAYLRDKLQSLLLNNIPGLLINGDVSSRLSGNLHISIPDVPNSAIIARVRSKLAISTGAACSSGVETPSHVLQALDLPKELIEGGLRIGLGKFTKIKEIEQAAEILSSAVYLIRQIMCSQS
ncbi:hypothetical protein LC613_40610 [Nostoc sphaeroides CHAB 2801]|uniref:hypothetical protein n=1 Tax=Nostoc sphaeroides TaxID=446679 RepID=UPI001E4CA44A|nr:hypothetical protein [Nostoc sphaeroides]MCC5633726.1 hypothetical protein [Nostoc sphaeroides CHAB 2801]